MFRFLLIFQDSLNLFHSFGVSEVISWNRIFMCKLWPSWSFLWLANKVSFHSVRKKRDHSPYFLLHRFMYANVQSFLVFASFCSFQQHNIWKPDSWKMTTLAWIKALKTTMYKKDYYNECNGNDKSLHSVCYKHFYRPIAISVVSYNVATCNPHESYRW